MEARRAIHSGELIALEFRCPQCEKLATIPCEEFFSADCCPRCDRALTPQSGEFRRVLEGLALFSSEKMKGFAFTLVVKDQAQA